MKRIIKPKIDIRKELLNIKPNSEKLNLEESIKDKVLPMLEETMEKNWGIVIPKIETDITDKLKNPSLNIYISMDLNFSEAKDKFKIEFLKRELRINRGNVSLSAKKLGINRRSIHRAIKDLKIDLDEIRKRELDSKNYQEEIVDKAIRTTLDQYKSLLHPNQMEKMYQQVETLSKNIARFIPYKEMSWKEAEREFEKQFLEQIIKNSQEKISKTARRIGIRPETLYRKIKMFDLKNK
jgi:DNA-binding NtrC family response regulator